MGNQQVIQSKTVAANHPRDSAIAHSTSAKPFAPKQPFTTRPAVHPLLQLQRQIGNQAVNRLIQAKLKVGKPNDIYEQEADRTADTVMRMPDPLIQRQEEEKTEEIAQAKPLVGTISPLVQRQDDEKEEMAQAKSLIGPITLLVQRQPQEEKKDETAQMLQRQAADEKKDETAQAKGTADATPEVSPHLESRIQTMRGGGQPLADSTRTFFESRFGYDFGGVRVHTDSQAAETASHLNAQAFTIGRDVFFGAGRYEPHTTSGQWLLAHELTHTVQQSPQPLAATSRVVQSHPDPGAQSSQFLQRQAPEEKEPETIQTKTEGAIAQRAAPKAIALSTSGNQARAITQPQSVTVSPALTQVQGIFDFELPGIDTVLNWAAERAANIPGFTLLTVILGRNPINNQPVVRNAVNLIRGVMGLVPGGELLFQGLQASGAIERVATWLEQQIDQLNITWEGIVALFTRALNSLSASDIFDIRGAGERVLNIFRPTLDRIRALAANVGSRVIQFIKEAILRPVGQFAQRLPFYPLLTVILGKNPITDEEVDRSPTNVIRGILLIIPGGEEKFQQLQQSGVLDRAFAWFNEQLTRLNLTWNSIKALFARAWDVLGIQDLLSPSAAFNKIQTIFGEPVQRITTFAGAAIRKVAEFIFEGVLTLAGGFGRQVLNIFNRARGVINTIIENPIGFIGNLVNAVKRGFQQFSSNILTHLQAGLIGWLFGALAGAGLQLPERFDLQGIVSLVMQILGLTYQRLRGILVRLLGSEERVQRAEQVFDFLVTLVRDGIAAAWERIVEFAGNLQEMVLGGIRDWVARTVVGQAITRLVTLFNPAGAVIQAIMAIYNTVVFFIERAQQIGALVEAVFESIASIAAGNIGAAASYVERTMARTIPVILGFLARFIDLGNVGEQIQNVVRRIQAPIENAMNRVADWIATQVRRLGGAIVGGARQAGQRIMNWLGIRKRIQLNNGEQHSLYFEQSGNQTILMVATNPITFRQFINSIGNNPRLNDDKQYAIRLIDEIDRLEDRSRNHNEDHNARIVELLEEVGRTTTALMNRAFRHDVRTTPPDYAGLRYGFGRGMRVMLVTDELRHGSRPSVTGSSTFNDLNLRRSGDGSYYILGHLLNEKLGGPGDRWENLTPLSRSGNSEHESKVERIIKPSTGDTPRAFLYVVTPSYSRVLNQGLIDAINAPSNPDLPTKKARKERVVRAEQFVPTNLVCSIREIDPLSGQNVGMNETYTIQNEVRQSSPADYEV